MRTFLLLMAFCALLVSPINLVDDRISSRVVQVCLPVEDVQLSYNEGDPFTVELKSPNASIEGIKFFIGDGQVALELKADPTDGILFQGKKLPHGYVFKTLAIVKVEPGFKKAKDLPPGTIYVKLPGVEFKIP